MNRSQKLLKVCEGGLFGPPDVLKDVEAADKIRAFLIKNGQDMFQFGMYQSIKAYTFGDIGDGLPYNYSASYSYQNQAEAQKGFDALVSFLKSGKPYDHPKGLIKKIMDSL